MSGGYLADIMQMLFGCHADVTQLPGGCLADVFQMSCRCLADVSQMSRTCLADLLRMSYRRGATNHSLNQEQLGPRRNGLCWHYVAVLPRLQVVFMLRRPSKRSLC